MSVETPGTPPTLADAAPEPGALTPLLAAVAGMPRPEDAQRVFHGRGGLHHGSEHWVLDAFPPVFVLTSFRPVAEADLAAVGEALAARWQQLAPGQALNWVFQLRHEGRSSTRLMAGAVPDPHEIGRAHV
jgi:23S rRNA (cytosine1962-C5)-methyltransferase